MLIDTFWASQPMGCLNYGVHIQRLEAKKNPVKPEAHSRLH